MFLDALVIFAIGFTVFHSPINTEIIRGLSVETTALASGLNRNGRHFAMTLEASTASLVIAINPISFVVATTVSVRWQQLAVRRAYSHLRLGWKSTAVMQQSRTLLFSST
jgi:hypothetical protein